MRALPLALCAGLAAALAAAPAVACIVAPPPDWNRVLTGDEPPVFVGRVVRVVREAEPVISPSYTLNYATATIRVLETLQGEYRPDIDVRGVEEVTYRAQSPLLCIERLNLDDGDLVIVVDGRLDNGARGPARAYLAAEIDHPALQPLIEKHQ